MISRFIVVRRYPLQFKRLFKSIHLPGNQYVGPVEKGIGADCSAGGRLIVGMRQAQTKQE